MNVLLRRLKVVRSQAGFTVIELMIATLVFSAVLVVITTGVISFTNSYFKGITVSRTQATTQDVTDRVTQSIQYSSSIVEHAQDSVGGSDKQAYCIGGTQYIYQLGKEQMSTPTADQTDHALYRRPVPATGCGTFTGFSAATTGTVDLLTDRMRVARFEINKTPGQGGNLVYTVNVRIVYGDDDLLDNPADSTANCKLGVSGRQFCAAYELSTVVQMRKTDV